MNDVKESRAYKYCEWALKKNNDMVPHYVKLQCESWKNIVDGKEPSIYVSKSTYKKIMTILHFMIHPDLKKPLDESLEDYAMFFIIAVFCTKMIDPDDNVEVRYYKTAVLKISRKNFKTFNAAVIFIILMIMEPRFSRFFSVAPDLKLSKELQIALRKIIKSSPTLDDKLDPAFKTLRSEIRCNWSESEYVPLAYSEDKMDGKAPAAFLADEAGAMDSYPVEAMRSGQITLINPLGIILSTEYPNDNNVMLDEVDKGKKILDGLRENGRMFSLIYVPDDYLWQGDIWQTDDRCIYQSNPVACTNKRIFNAIVEKRTDAIAYENKRENYLCKHNNIKYKGLGVEGYVEITKVRKCKRKRNDAYVNAVGRDSRPIRDKTTGKRFVEQIVPGTFRRALAKNEVKLLLDHDHSRELGSTETNLTLYEDNIGLRAEAEITDPEVIEKAKNKKLRGWSFGFKERDASEEETKSGLTRRYVEDMILAEVSLIDEKKIPAYEGTSVETRAESEELIKADVMEVKTDYVERAEVSKPSLEHYKKRILKLKGGRDDE